MLPKHFELAGTTWTVEQNRGLSELGNCDYEASTIRIRAELSDQVKLATFFHELMHAILFMMGEREHDEKKVDAMGQLLHQFAVTGVYPKAKGKKR